MKLAKFVGQDFLDDAHQHHQLIYLTLDDKKLINVIDLPKMWMKNQDIYYIVKYNVCGHIKQLSQIVELKDQINNAITGYNYENSDAFGQQIELFDQWMITTLIDNKSVAGSTMNDLIAVTHKPLHINTNKLILDKLSQLPFGKYMDVSDLNKIKYLNMNKKKFVATNIRIMSNNYNNFNYIINILPGGTKKYAEDLQKAQIFFGLNKSEQQNTSLSSTVDVGVTVKTVRKYERKPRAKPFLQQLNTIGVNKVLDVSHIDATGKNTEVIDKKDLPNYYYAIDLKIISDNYDAFLQAIELIPNGLVKYTGDLILAKAFFGIVESDSDETTEDSEES